MSEQLPTESQAEKEPLNEPHEHSAQREIDLGVQWFSRIGMVLMLVGLVYAACYAIPHLTVEWKLFLGCLLSLSVFIGGNFLETSPQIGPLELKHHGILARILQGGGLALGFINVFGAFFIPELQVFQEPQAGWACLMMYVAGMFFVAHQKSSQTMAMLALLLGYFTTNYSVDTTTALCSSLLLSLSALWISNILQPNWHWVRNCVPLAGFYCYLASFTSPNPITTLPLKSFLPDLEKTRLAFLGIHFLASHLFSLGLNRSPRFALFVLNFWGTFLALVFSCFSGDSPLTQTLLDEGYIAGFLSITSLSSYLFAKYKSNNQDATWLQTLLTHGLMFLVFTTCALGNERTVVGCLAAQAILYAWLSRKLSSNSLPYAICAFFALALAYCFLFFVMLQGNIPAPTSFLLCTLCFIAGISIDACIFKKPERIKQNRFQLFSALFMAYNQFVILFFSCILCSSESIWLSALWTTFGLSLMGAGMVLPSKTYRIVGMIWFIPVLIKLLLVDTANLPEEQKILAYLGTGAAMLATGFLYSTFAKKIMNP